MSQTLFPWTTIKDKFCHKTVINNGRFLIKLCPIFLVTKTLIGLEIVRKLPKFFYWLHCGIKRNLKYEFLLPIMSFVE